MQAIGNVLRTVAESRHDIHRRSGNKKQARRWLKVLLAIDAGEQALYGGTLIPTVDIREELCH